MPNRISKSQFRSRMNGHSISLNKVQEDNNIESHIKGAAQESDLNRDGKISGSTETNTLFSKLDHFDRDGSRYSMHNTNSISSLLGHARSNTVTKSQFQGQLRNKSIRLFDLQANPDISNEVKSALPNADLNRDGKIQGRDETGQLFKELDDFDRNGSSLSMKRTADIDAVLDTAVEIPREPGQTVDSNLQFTRNNEAIRRARATSLGEKAAEKVPEYAHVYNQASELTGVPPELLAAIHGNESQFGTYSPSSRGPEAGFGLDPRFVSTSWGNEKLAEHGLGSWRRGQSGETAMLQSAVIAGEHLKRNASYANIDIKPEMDQNELSGAVMSYMQGIRAARSAHARGSSWMLRPTDNNPHPLHPGGTSIGRNGQTIRVAPSRKEGLLRWDALLPLIEENLRS